MLDDALAVLEADGVAEPAHRLAAAPEVSELARAAERGRVPDDVVVNVVPVCVRADKKGVTALRETERELIADLICLLRRDLAGQERLPQLVGDDVALLAASGQRKVLALCEQKLRVGGLRRALVGGDKFPAAGLGQIFCVVRALGQAARDAPAAVRVHGYDAGRRHEITSSF